MKKTQPKPCVVCGQPVYRRNGTPLTCTIACTEERRQQLEQARNEANKKNKMNTETQIQIMSGLIALTEESHGRARASGWYTNPETGEPLVRNVPEMLMLVVSEVAEAMEGYRKALQDDKLPHRTMIEVELADVLIRLGDLAGYLGLDLAGAVIEKMDYNNSRSDHKLENRAKEGGKKF